MGGKKGTNLERFERHYSRGKKNDCWEWQRSKNESGYGIFYYPPRNMVQAHIVAWELYKGSRRGLQVLHKCDNPACVNLNHLQLGTHQENMRQRDERGRRAPPIGVKNGRAKVTEKQVRAIRKDKRPPRFLAREYPIPYSTIQKIRQRVTWKHVS